MPTARGGSAAVHDACTAPLYCLMPCTCTALQVLAFLEQWCPQLEEAQLLRDAMKQLDELFLLVVLGEFNSGE